MLLERLKAVETIGYVYGWLGTTYKPDDLAWELMFTKANGWMFRKRDGTSFTIYMDTATNDLLQIFENANIDLLQVNMLLCETILTHAVSVYNRAVSLTSENSVHKAIRSWDDFGKALAKTIDTTIRKSKLGVIDGGKDVGKMD